jgi:hypothetical protein
MFSACAGSPCMYVWVYNTHTHTRTHTHTHMHTSLHRRACAADKNDILCVRIKGCCSNKISQHYKITCIYMHIITTKGPQTRMLSCVCRSKGVVEINSKNRGCIHIINPNELANIACAGWGKGRVRVWGFERARAGQSISCLFASSHSRKFKWDCLLME